MPHLLFLNLSHNHLPDLEYVGLESLRSLEVLDLSYNRLSRVSSDSLAAMEWLVELKVFIATIPRFYGRNFKRQTVTVRTSVYLRLFKHFLHRDRKFKTTAAQFMKDLSK